MADSSNPWDELEARVLEKAIERAKKGEDTQDAILELGSEDGKSKNKTYPKGLNLLAHAIEYTQGSASKGSVTSGQVAISDLICVSGINNAVANMLTSAANPSKKKFDKAVLHLMATGNQEYGTITLSNSVIVSDIKLIGAGDTKYGTLMAFKLSFGKIAMEYKPIDATGVGAPQKHEWDLATNA